MVARDLEDLSGQQIGNYEIISHIAARKASDLFLARDVKLERLVFLEVLRVTSEEDPDLAERFTRRMETVAQLKDPHIAIISDIDFTEDNFPYAVIEYFPGISLAEKLSLLQRNQETLPVIESLELAKQIAQGLGVAHAADLIHHDLRPENIILREDGTPVLIDLGLPAITGTRRAGLTGPDSDMLDYTAPEELDGKPLTRRSNIYSLGVILYELLSGHRPMLPVLPYDIFPQANMPKEEPLEEARPGLAGETYRLVRNCLWRQEWSRYETTEELITAIETAIFAEQELPKAAAWTPKRGRSMAFVIPIAVILLGVLGFMLLRSASTRGNGEEVGISGPGDSTPVGGVISSGTVTTTTSTAGIPTESATIFSISVLAPGPNRQFTTRDTINFDWFWPTLPEAGRHFAVYLLDGGLEFLLGSLTEPNNGAAYRLPVTGNELPATGDSLNWQVRLESVNGNEVLVASDRIPIVVLPAGLLETPTVTRTSTATVTSTATPTDTPTPDTCVVSPPPGWVLYGIRQGDSLAGLAARANTPVEDLMRVNCLSNDILSVGQEIWVPRSALPSSPTPVIVPTSPPPTSAPQPLPTATTAPPTNAPPPTFTTEPPLTEPPTKTPPPSPFTPEP
jgi:serine/threonine protein kinase/LysM repeat protein